MKKRNPFNFLSLFNFRKARGYQMKETAQHGDLLDMRTVQQMVKDIGREKTLEYFAFLEQEFALRTDNILVAFKNLDLEHLAREIHAFKGCALTIGAKPLGSKLDEIEKKAKAGDYDALARIGELLEITRRTSEACKSLKLD